MEGRVHLPDPSCHLLRRERSKQLSLVPFPLDLPLGLALKAGPTSL